MTQAAAPPPHLTLTGADPSPPGNSQTQTSVDNPHPEVEIKPQLKPRGSVTEEENPKHSYHAGVQLQQPGNQPEGMGGVGEYRCSLSFIFLGLHIYFKLKILFYTFTKALGQRFDIFSSH